MARPQAHKSKTGRNDPCWCGSGKKYKDCHLPIEQAHRAEQLKLREAQDTLLPKIIAAAQSVPEAFPAAFEQFWQGEYTPDQMGELDDLEERGAERFLVWFAFDYVMESGTTLVEQLAQVADVEGFEVDAYEKRLLESWINIRMRPYQVAEVHKGKGVTLRDLLDGDICEVADYAAAKRLNVDEVVIGHITPADRPFDAEKPIGYFAGAAAQLTADTAAKLVEFAELHLADLRRTQADATWSDLLRRRSYALNHFVMALPREEDDPSLLDKVVFDARVSLQLTADAISGLLGRDAPEASEDAANAPKEDTGEDAANAPEAPEPDATKR